MSDAKKLDALRAEAKRGFDQLDSGFGVTRTAEEFVADLRARRSEVQSHEEREVKLAALRTAIDDGDASGVFDDDPFAATRAKYRLNR